MNHSSRFYWVLGGLLYFCLVFAHQKKFDSATPVSRLDLLHALVLQHTVCIDAYHTNTPDKSVFQGHYYSDKAPGTVVAALTAFAASAQILKWANISLDSKTGWLVSSWIACAGSVALITALGGVALFAWLCHWTSPRAALVTVLAIFLGAAPLPYSTMMFSHAMVIGLISVAIWALRLGFKNLSPPAPSSSPPLSAPCSSLLALRSSLRLDLLAGFCSGWALASEYSSGLVVMGLFVWLLAVGWRRAVRFTLAALPPLLLIPAYNWACLGTPFTLPYTFQASFPEMKRGLYAIQWPDPVTAWNLLIPPTRGLLFWTPFLAMAGLGYWGLSGQSRWLFILTYTVPLVHILVISGRSWDWQGGFVLGPRLLSPMLPLLVLPCALGLQCWPRLGLVLAVYSVEITTLATLTDAVVTSEYYNPLTDLHLPLLIQGEFSPNLATAIGLPSYVSIGLFYAVLILGAGWLWCQRAVAPISNTPSPNECVGDD